MPDKKKNRRRTDAESQAADFPSPGGAQTISTKRTRGTGASSNAPTASDPMSPPAGPGKPVPQQAADEYVSPSAPLGETPPAAARSAKRKRRRGDKPEQTSRADRQPIPK